MGRWAHKLSAVNADRREAVCAHCGPTDIVSSGSRAGMVRWRCGQETRRRTYAKRHNGRLVYRNYKGELCERCGFYPEDPCQLDVHHLDGNHSNNDFDNLQTVCANCHRLIHKQFPKE